MTPAEKYQKTWIQDFDVLARNERLAALQEKNGYPWTFLGEAPTKYKFVPDRFQFFQPLDHDYFPMIEVISADNLEGPSNVFLIYRGACCVGTPDRWSRVLEISGSELVETPTGPAIKNWEGRILPLSTVEGETRLFIDANAFWGMDTETVDVISVGPVDWDSFPDFGYNEDDVIDQLDSESDVMKYIIENFL